MHAQGSYNLHHTVSLWDGSAGSLSFVEGSIITTQDLCTSTGLLLLTGCTPCYGTYTAPSH